MGIIDQFLWPRARETKCEFEGHMIAVGLMPEEVTLYVDGNKVDSKKPLLLPRRDVAILRGPTQVGDSRCLVEVFAQSGFLGAKIKICVDGNRIAGDDF
ncbi:MAG TPA: hypothetical protein VIF02_14255 [Methylocella sp.]